jgi:hypothetical protein
MALTLSARAQVLSQKRNIKPNLILEIDDVPTVYTTLETLEIITFDSGHVFDEEGLVFDGGAPIEDQEILISLSGSGTTITQQLQIDKGAASSVSSLEIELLDKNGQISNLISPGFVVEDLLTKKARIFLNWDGGLHPQDSVLIHRGIIDEIAPQQGSVKIRVAHPEQLKRQELFIPAATKLNGAIDASVTTIPVDTTNGFILPSAPELASYFKLEDEYIEFENFDGVQFTGCTRGALDTVAAAHDDDTEVSSFYTLADNGIDLALKLMMSQAADLEVPVLNIGAFDVDDIDETVIFFENFDIEDELGIVVGDLVSLTGATNVGNNISLSAITSIGQTETGSYVTVDEAFTTEFGTSAIAAFKSQYNVLTEGMGMTSQDVDVPRHLDLQVKFSSTIPDYEFYIKDVITGKDFVSEQLYKPAGLYSLPRKSKASVGITIPPLAEAQVPTLDETRIVNPASLKSTRSINRNFYNAIVYKYDESLDDDKFLAGKVEYSADSQNRLPNVGNKPFTIEAKGLRPSDGTETLIRLNTRRLLERYRYGSELIPGVKLLGKDGFKIECGDIVIAKPPKLTDLDQGSRNRQVKLYEVVNKSLNIKTFEVTVDLLGTNFAIDGRYGVISPSTYVGVGSTTSEIIIKDSFSTQSPAIEKDKWTDFLEEKILVHSQDWTYAHETTLLGFDPGNKYKMLVDPPLPTPPDEDFIIDIPYYDNDSPEEGAKYKLMFCHFNPQVLVVSAASGTQFTIGGGDVSKFFVGSILRVHSTDYSVDSSEVQVSDITGNTITVDTDLGFTPLAGYEIDLVGFQDEGLPYRLI